jgi:hypothetical protein
MPGIMPLMDKPSRLIKDLGLNQTQHRKVLVTCCAEDCFNEAEASLTEIQWNSPGSVEAAAARPY